ncbi:hypothetical protein N8590_03085 [bacterium]|nr:hypothetical protein [bacterium]
MAFRDSKFSICFASIVFLCLAFVSNQSSNAEDLKLLFLGDNGHHRPVDRFAELAPVLAEKGIDLKRRRVREAVSVTHHDPACSLERDFHRSDNFSMSDVGSAVRTKGWTVIRTWSDERTLRRCFYWSYLHQRNQKSNE